MRIRSLIKRGIYCSHRYAYIPSTGELKMGVGQKQRGRRPSYQGFVGKTEKLF